MDNQVNNYLTDSIEFLQHNLILWDNDDSKAAERKFRKIKRSLKLETYKMRIKEQSEKLLNLLISILLLISFANR